MIVESGLLVDQYTEYPSGVVAALLLFLWYGGYTYNQLRGRVMLNFDGFDGYRQDVDLEAGKGIVLELEDGRTITIHRAGGANKRYQKALTEQFKKYRRQFQKGTLDPEVIREITKKVYAETVVIDWSGITVNGEELPCTKDNILAFFQAFPEIYEEVEYQASLAANFLQEQIQEDSESLGN